MALIIQTIVNNAWFQDAKDDGVVHPKFSEGWQATLAFILTVVHLRVMTEAFSL